MTLQDAIRARNIKERTAKVPITIVMSMFDGYCLSYDFTASPPNPKHEYAGDGPNQGCAEFETFDEEV